MTVVESPQQYVRPLYQYMEGFDVEDYIDAATTVLDEDTRWQNEEHLLARVREALDGDA